MMDPELDDVVERSYGYQILSDTAHVGGLIGGLLTAGAVESPSRPVTSPALDPRQVLNGDQEQIRRRLEQISPAAGRHFVGMWQGIVERESRVTAVAEAFHNAREMVSALNEVLVEVARARAEQTGNQLPPLPDEGRATEAWNLSVLTQQLGLSTDVAKEWKGLRLHRVAHRNGLRVPREATEEMVNLAHSAERVARGLADLYERHIEVVFAEVDRLLSTTANSAGAERLAHLAPPDHEVVRSFFEQLDDPEWWTFLRTAKFFDDPPCPIAPLIHPRWPQSRYLARVAHRVSTPADLVVLFLKIGENTANVRVHEDLLRAATKLPPKYAAQILETELAWPKTLLHERVARLVGEPEIIRYPAWLAGLQLHVATHPGSIPATRQKAEEALRSLLRVRVVDEEYGPGFDVEEMDDAALQPVLRHVRAHATDKGREAAARLLAHNVEEISRVLIREMAGEMPADDDPATPDSAFTALLGWFTGQGEPEASDQSHLLLRSWHTETARPDVEALAGLMMGLSGLLAEVVARGGDPALVRPEALGPTYTGLWDRARLSALLHIDPLPAAVTEELLLDRSLARAAVVREEYVLVLQHVWGGLSAPARQRIRDALGGSNESDPMTRLIAKAPLLGLDREIPDEEAFVAEVRAVSSRPRAFLSVARGQPDPYADEDARARGLDVRGTEQREAPLAGASSASERGGTVEKTEMRASMPKRPVAWGVRAEELIAREQAPSASEWAEVVDVLSPRWTSRARLQQLPDVTRAQWIAVAARWLGRGAWPEPHLRDRLVRFALRKDLGWAAAGEPRGNAGIAHHGLKAAESSPHAQVLWLKITLLTNSKNGLTAAQRRRVMSSLKGDLASGSPMRPTLLTVLGLLLPSVHAGAPDAWSELILPLLRELPELPQLESVSAKAPSLSPRALDLAALYSGLTMGWQPVSPAFVGEIRPFLVWAYANLRVLGLPGGLTPSPFVLHAFALIYGELMYEQRPGEVLGLILDAAPPLLAVGALRKFAELPLESADIGMPVLLRGLWAGVLEWAKPNPERAGGVLAAIGTWASKPDLVDALGRDWMLSRLDEVIRTHGTLDFPVELISSFAVLVERSPVHAEPVVEIALLLRNSGLLRRHHGRELKALVDSLAAAPIPPALLPELRSALNADRIIGPLSVDSV